MKKWLVKVLQQQYEYYEYYTSYDITQIQNVTLYKVFIMFNIAMESFWHSI